MTSEKNEQIKELIERAAKAAGSEAAAARAAGLQRSQVNAYKTGAKEAPPEALAALAGVAGLNGVEWLTRATLWRAKGRPTEEALKKALAGALQATGEAVRLCSAAVVGLEAWARCSTMYLLDSLKLSKWQTRLP